MVERIDLSVLVPAYNERENICPLYLRLKEVLTSIGGEFEIVFVDDGSIDGTFEAMKSLHDADQRVRLVKLRMKYGQTAALDIGFKRCKGDVIVQMDADLQNDPSDIPLMLKKLDEGYDCVCGWRYDRMDTFSKRIFSQIANTFRRAIINDGVHDEGYYLRVYWSDVIKGIRLDSTSIVSYPRSYT